MKTSNNEEYAKVKNFYSNLIGLSIIKESDDCVLFDAGAGIVEIFRNGMQNLKDGVIGHFAFDVDNTDSYIEKVRKAGYEIIMEPTNVQIGGDPAFPARVAFSRGPLGEKIEFFCQMW